ncbi:S1 family peptidase [Pseudanabaena sp. PCC 6802]|uniref:S1 family peptidase n=1 Tax=Pseudanabaena sp. PCC 6802 TaxID=118173 RepID=UPI00034B53A3|nr:serine protease [Pseudanabaena sp. PCC 6802]
MWLQILFRAATATVPFLAFLACSTSVQAQKLSDTEVNNVAQHVTVIIAEGLQEGDVEAQNEFNPGSGFIVAKLGNTYFAATNLHVALRPDAIYGIRTYDGKVHFSTNGKASSNLSKKGITSFPIIYFGEAGEDGKIKGFDLAVVGFQSDRDYPVAKVNLVDFNKNDRTFVFGWPDPGDRTPRRTCRFSPGNLQEILNPPNPNGGYGLLYSSETYIGMSGGPVFNDRGEIIGIHGRGKEPTVPFNQGIKARDLKSEAEKYKLQVFQSSIDPSSLAAIAPPPAACLIPNIYQDFTRDFKSAALGDKPSGGDGNILIPD